MKRNALLNLLMLCSEALLCAFLAIWLSAQWRKEEEALRKDLSARYNTVYKQVNDSVIRFRLVNPALERNKAMKPVRVLLHDPPAPGSIPPGVHLSTTMVVTRKNIHGGHPDSAINPPDTAIMHLMQGVQIMIDASFPDSLRGSVVRQDTQKVRSRFIAVLDKERMHFNLRWVAPQTQARRDTIMLQATEFPRSEMLAVSGYKPFLFRRVLPPLFFAISLLLITAAAFLLAWRSLRRERRLSQMKNSLVSNMSHELKTPVTTVKVALEALGDEAVQQDRATVREYVGMATQELQRLELLINGTLHTSLMESGKLPMQYAPVDLRLVTEELIETLRLRFQKAGATVYLSFTGEDFTANADKLHIQGVLLNIIDNALKYGGDGVVLRIEGIATPGIIRLSVSDNGPGIPAAYRKRVFEKFFRVPTGNLHLVKGYGLGLSYAAEVMRLHGGSISVSSADDGGSTFTLQLTARAKS